MINVQIQTILPLSLSPTNLFPIETPGEQPAEVRPVSTQYHLTFSELFVQTRQSKRPFEYLPKIIVVVANDTM